MSITDELRRFIEDPLLGYASQDQHIETLTKIADRIDAEYQKAIRELNNLADASVLLPVDADGEYIRIGDDVEGLNGENADATHLTVHMDGSWDVGTRGWVPHLLRHRKPDTWERIIRDAIVEGMARELSNYNGGYDRSDSLSNASLVARCKALAGDAE